MEDIQTGKWLIKELKDISSGGKTHKKEGFRVGRYERVRLLSKGGACGCLNKSCQWLVLETRRKMANSFVLTFTEWKREAVDTV